MLIYKRKILLREGKRQSTILIKIANQLLEELKEVSQLDCKIRKGGTCTKKQVQNLLSKMTILVGTRRYYFYNK